MKVLFTFIYFLVSFELGYSSSFSTDFLPTYTAKKEEFVIDVLTVYNPESGQTDSTPLITADNSKIDLGKLKRGELRWLALSRDFLRGGKLNYGDTIEIISEDKDISGKWILRDTMNKRYKKRGDLLFANRKYGKWKNVTFRKI